MAVATTATGETFAFPSAWLDLDTEGLSKTPSVIQVSHRRHQDALDSAIQRAEGAITALREAKRGASEHEIAQARAECMAARRALAALSRLNK